MDNISASDIQIDEVDVGTDSSESVSVSESSKPNKKLIFLAGLALVVFIVVGSMLVSKATVNQNSEQVDLRSGLAADAETSDTPSVQSFADLSPSNQELLGSLPAAITKLDTLDDRLDAISNRIEALNSVVLNFNSETDNTLFDHNQSIDQLNRADLDIKSAISTVNVRLDEFQKSFDDFRKKSKRKSSKVAPPIKSSVMRKPPFKLISVQIWNGSPLAVINYRSSNMSVNADDVIADWFIVSVTAAPDCITVKETGINKAKEQLLCL